MEGAGILAGDLVIVNETRNAQPGSIVAVTVDGETTLKILRKKSGKWLLVPANPRYSAIEVNSPATIHGVVTAVMRIVDGEPTRAAVPQWRPKAHVRTKGEH